MMNDEWENPREYFSTFTECEGLQGSISCPTPSLCRGEKAIPRKVNRFIQGHAAENRGRIRPRTTESRVLVPEKDGSLPPTCQLL